MKKLFMLMMTGILAVSLLVSCGGTKVIDVEAAADSLVNALEFDGEMDVLDNNLLESTYVGINLENIVKSKVYTAVSSTAEEAAVFEAKDEAAATELKKLLEEYASSQKELYASYDAEGAARLDKAVVRQSGKYVVYCVAGDGGKTSAEVEKVLK